jgi:ABC-type branched-subunit amino acid transport system ATPase component
MKVLDVIDLSVYRGNNKILKYVSLEVYSNEIVAIVGANGCGKTTLFNSISGFLRPATGKIFINGVDTTYLKPHQIAKLGVSRTFQDRGIFENMSIMDATEITETRNNNLLKDIFNFKLRKIVKSKALHKLNKFLPNVDYSKNCDELSTGQQAKLKLASLYTESKLLLLDEPTAGVDKNSKKVLLQHIQDISKNCAVLLIEHDMNFVKKCADRILYMDDGKFIREVKQVNNIRKRKIENMGVL